ncbi:MAG TPA: decaprenyl-phosphate phosphoribosyltransferase, partial [Ktedonobacteraceae bacterium]|nr:decaprenyl-phosphate phosphoribosyltransferase [Ktedonobacteraceae bacterium]
TIKQKQQSERQTGLHSFTTNGVTPQTAKQGIGFRIHAVIQSMRPRQWTKNLALFVGLVFAQQLFNVTSFERAFVAFVVFCLASSSIYIFNDLLDLERDRQHPTKSKRPLASGNLPVSWAIVSIGIMILGCAGLTLLIFNIPIQQTDIFASLGGANVLFALTVASYILLMALYSVRLKHIVLLDVFIIASGFVLRILAGAVVIPVMISPWLYLVTILLSLFLALSKRRHELVLLQGEASNHRQILKEYSLPLLDQLITIVIAATIMAYSLYTFQGPTGNHRLMITIPLVLYGMFRYLYLMHMRMEGGSPEEVLLRDRHMLGTVVLCTVLIIVVLYALPK